MMPTDDPTDEEVAARLAYFDQYPGISQVGVGEVRRLIRALEAARRERDQARADMEARIHAAMVAGRAVGRTGVELEQIDREDWKRALDAAHQDIQHGLIAECEFLAGQQERLVEALEESSRLYQEASEQECTCATSENDVVAACPQCDMATQAGRVVSDAVAAVRGGR